MVKKRPSTVLLVRRLHWTWKKASSVHHKNFFFTSLSSREGKGAIRCCTNGEKGGNQVFFVPFPFLLRENVSPKKKSFDSLDHLARSSGEGQHNSTRVVCTVMEEEEAPLNKTVGDRGNSRCNKVSPSFSSFSCLFSSSSPLIPCGRQYVRGNSNFSRRVVIFCLGNLNRSFVKKLK